MACLDSQVNCLALQGAAGVDDEDDAGLTPLHTAAELGATGLAELLLEKGADLNHAGGLQVQGPAAAVINLEGRKLQDCRNYRTMVCLVGACTRDCSRSGGSCRLLHVKLCCTVLRPVVLLSCAQVLLA